MACIESGIAARTSTVAVSGKDPTVPNNSYQVRSR
jgi:hypothetical protein